MQKKALALDDDILANLSPETLAALRAFAVTSGAVADEKDAEADDSNPLGVLQALNDHFGVQEREERFEISYTSKNDPSRSVSFTVRGLKKVLGQTLQSTGLTIWRAAEHLCQYLIDNPDRIANKRVCELGAGLGLVSILADKMNVNAQICCTDGDEETMELLVENKIDCDCAFETSYLYWGEHQDFCSEHPEKFDVILAADVIYDEAQVEPLIDTAADLLLEDGEMILGFARRQVPLQQVLDYAQSKGFVSELLSSHEDFGEMEPILSFKWKAKDN